MINQPAPLTVARLIELEACTPQIELFRATFGESVDLANPPEGYEALAFNWDWAARNLLNAAAQAEYYKATAAAWAECEKARAAAWAECEKARAAAWAAYRKARATAWAEYDKARATAFVAGYVATFCRQNRTQLR